MANFFERQEEARWETARLVAIYGLTVLLLILGLYMSVVFLLKGTVVLQSWILPAVSILVLQGIWVARTTRLSELRRGGHVVAELLGGQQVDPSQATSGRAQLMNVVEEMAIAAGAPAPQVYVLPEKGINAFSAGFTPEDAVIGVTQGALQQLDRDELQAVVAHEFSHILNGDMRLNLRLMSWTRALELMRDLGARVVKWLFYAPVRLMQGAWKWWGGLYKFARELTSKNLAVLILIAVFFLPGGAAFLILPAVAAGTLSIGLIFEIFQNEVLWSVAVISAVGAGLGGTAHLCARLLKARVSKEREFLADAAATQFTRNPEALGRALLKQRDCDHGGRVQAGGVRAARHLFFGDAVGQDGSSAQWLPTHPPAEQRVRRIAPSLLEESGSSERRSARNQSARDGEASSGASTEESAPPYSPEDLIDRAWTLTPEMLSEAQALHASIPEGVLKAAHEPLGAVAVTHALMLSEEESVRSLQWDLLWHQEPSSIFEETKRLYEHISSLERPLRLPLVEVAAPSLRKLSSDQQGRFLQTIRDLAEADDRITIFEFALTTVAFHYLDDVDRPVENAGWKPLTEVREETVALLSELARAGHDSETEVRRAFEAGDRPLAESHDLKPAELTSPGPSALHEALGQLARTSPKLRKEILQACVRCASADDRIERSESELLRAVAVALGVPLPAGWAGEGLPEGAEGDAAEPKSLEGA